MTESIALLRGVNVGGITIRSAELREVFEQLGFRDVRTVLASGNVAFTVLTREAPTATKRRIEQALGDRFGYEAWIILISRAALERAIDAFPFDAEDERRQPWVVFASEPRVVDELMEFGDGADPEVDPIARGDGVVYWNPVKGTTVDTPFAKLLAKAKFKPVTTNRNLRTLRKLVA